VTNVNVGKDECVDCNKIKCRNCGWEPDQEQEKKVLSGLLSKCPDCGGGK